jgi:hypothetical protein
MKNEMYVHEYGHYLQSQSMSWGYLFEVGIPSLLSAERSKGKHIGYKIGTDGKIYYLSPHDVYRKEMVANREAAYYFHTYYGVVWAGDGYIKYPLSYLDALEGLIR